MMNMKKGYVILFFLAAVLAGCEKVKDLSDEASVERFWLTGYSPEEARVDSVYLSAPDIVIPVRPGEGLFPFRVDYALEVSRTTHKVLGDYAEGQPLVFSDGGTEFKFQLVAESGMVHEYVVSLYPLETGADISTFAFEGSNASTVEIDPWTASVYISTPGVDFEEGQTVTLRDVRIGYFGDLTVVSQPEEYTFTSFDDVKRIVLRSADGETERTWTVRFVNLIQIPNSDFESWGQYPGVNLGEMTIDPTPGKGEGWATANNSFVQGTLPVSYNGGKAAQMTTNVQNALVFGELIAAGSLYTGEFVFDIGALNNPRKMTHFGIPYTLQPESVEFDARYVPGPVLKRAVKEGSKYHIEDTVGVDCGQAWVELLYYDGTGEFEYHGQGEKEVEVLGRGEIVFDGSDSRYATWGHYVMPIVYANRDKLPTHIVIVFSSSKGGDKFIGAPGSTMEVDNVKLIY